MEVKHDGVSGFVGLNKIDDKENICSIDSEIRNTNNSKIVNQCEFYFSNANILKDPFLLNHVKSSKDGWVDLQIIEKFSKMQCLSKDHSEITKALSESSKLELSQDGKFVRRRDPLPEWDKSVYFRTLLISDFPVNEKISIDTINDVFKDNDTPVLIRLCWPGKKVQSDLKRSQMLHPQLGTKLCAVIEFKDVTAAKNAIPLISSKWSQAYVKILSDGCKKIAKEKNKLKKTFLQVRSSDEHRPLIFKGLELLENQTRVIHIREPTGPPNQDSVGFPTGWRDLLCKVDKMKSTEFTNIPQEPIIDDVINQLQGVN